MKFEYYNQGILSKYLFIFLGDWQTVFDEVKQMKEPRESTHMKAILAFGKLGTMENIYKALMVCMQAESDFIPGKFGNGCHHLGINYYL